MQVAFLAGVLGFLAGAGYAVWRIWGLYQKFVGELFDFNSELIEDNKRLGQNIVQMGEASDRRVAELLAEGRFE